LGEPGDQSNGHDFPAAAAAEFFLWDYLRAIVYETRPTGFPKLEKAN